MNKTPRNISVSNAVISEKVAEIQSNGGATGLVSNEASVTNIALGLDSTPAKTGVIVDGKKANLKKVSVSPQVAADGEILLASADIYTDSGAPDRKSVV